MATLGTVDVDCPACGEPVSMTVLAEVETITPWMLTGSTPMAISYNLAELREHITARHPEMLDRLDAATTREDDHA